MTPQLTVALNEIIATELVLSMAELNEMNHSQEMGLQGYKRFHRFYSMDRHRHALMLSNYIVEHHNIAPVITVTFDSRSYVSASLLESLKSMHSRSSTHLMNLKRAAKMAAVEDDDALMGMLECLIEDETWELARYAREVQELTFSGGDKSFMLLHSDKLHCKYKKKEKEYFNYPREKGC